MEKKRIYIFIAVLIVVVLMFLVILIIFKNKTQNEEIKLSEEIQEKIEKYFDESETHITSVSALIENGYIDKNTKIDKCIIFESTSSGIKERSDCQESERIAKKPIIVIDSTNNFNFNGWNKTGTTLSYSIKTGGSNNYKEDDILKSYWVDQETDKRFDINKLTIESVNINKLYSLNIEFKDGYKYQKIFGVSIDTEVPVLSSKVIEYNAIWSYYDDFSGTPKIYYAMTLDNIEPSRSDMKLDNNFNLDCNKTYHAWSYAIDSAGNESSVDYLGEYTPKCYSIPSSQNE